jgi:electron transfer flavoprotein beta subunit
VQRIIEILQPALVFTGEALLDRGDDPAPALAAANLDLPYVKRAVALEREGNEVEVLRKGDRGARQRMRAEMPCAVFF